MAGGKETPRQKMIGMMYLVLTALLALNVSVEILKSFVIVNDAVDEANSNYKKKVEAIYSQFRNAHEVNPQKTEDKWQRALLARQKSDSLLVHLRNLKAELISYCDGIPLETAKTLHAKDIKKQDNYDKPTQFLIGQSEDGRGGKAHELRLKIEDFKKSMLNLLDTNDRDKVQLGLNTQGPFYDANGNEKNWEMQHFYKTIVVADLTILSKLETEILNAEFDVVSQLYSSVSEDDFKFDNIAARIVPKSAS